MFPAASTAPQGHVSPHALREFQDLAATRARSF